MIASQLTVCKVNHRGRLCSALFFLVDLSKKYFRMKLFEQKRFNIKKIGVIFRSVLVEIHLNMNYVLQVYTISKSNLLLEILLINYRKLLIIKHRVVLEVVLLIEYMQALKYFNDKEQYRCS